VSASEGNTSRRRGRRRANGEGSVWQRKDGRWAFAGYALTTGGMYKRVQGYGRDQADARAKLNRLLADSDRGVPVASENWTVAEYLDYWLEHVVRAERRPKTVQGYEGVIRRYLVPGLGKKRLAKLTARDVRTFVTNIRQLCQCCRNGTDAARERPRCCALPRPECCGHRLSARMVQSVHAVLRNALQTAVREEVIPRNVASLVKVSPPRYAVNRGLDVAQARRLLKASENDRFHALYVLALCLGLRRGELLGLRWCDVDLDAGRLEVVHTLQRVGGKLALVPPKTEDSARTVPLPGVCLDALRAHRRRQFAQRSDAFPD
jgi:integrase